MLFSLFFAEKLFNLILPLMLSHLMEKFIPDFAQMLEILFMLKDIRELRLFQSKRESVTGTFSLSVSTGSSHFVEMEPKK